MCTVWFFFFFCFHKSTFTFTFKFLHAFFYCSSYTVLYSAFWTHWAARQNALRNPESHSPVVQPTSLSVLFSIFQNVPRHIIEQLCKQTAKRENLQSGCWLSFIPLVPVLHFVLLDILKCNKCTTKDFLCLSTFYTNKSKQTADQCWKYGQSWLLYKETAFTKSNHFLGVPVFPVTLWYAFPFFMTL